MSEPLSATLIDTAQALRLTLLGQTYTEKLSPAGQHWLFETQRHLGWVHGRLYDLLDKKPPSVNRRMRDDYSPYPALLEPRELEALLMIALTMLKAKRYHPATLLNEAVNAAKSLGNLSGLVNALLRQAVQTMTQEEPTMMFAPKVSAAEQASAGDSLPISPMERFFRHPYWWMNKCFYQFGKNPEYTAQILHANLVHPPMVLRANPLWGDAHEAIKVLSAKGIGARLMGDWQLSVHAKMGNQHQAPKFWQTLLARVQPIVLERPQAVDDLPDFARGRFSVQDAASQIAVHALNINAEVANQGRVLDACAAPGGKSGQLAEILYQHLRGKASLSDTVAVNLPLWALEINPQRLSLCQENRARLRMSYSIIQGDLTTPNHWWDGKLFDRILLDAPCSSSGTVRRHPDTLWRIREADIQTQAQTQKQLLESAWQLLADGGILVYSTCSIFAEENHFLLRQFARTHDLDWESIQSLMTIPGAEHDGHFIAVMHKTSG